MVNTSETKYTEYHEQINTREYPYLYPHAIVYTNTLASKLLGLGYTPKSSWEPTPKKDTRSYISRSLAKELAELSQQLRTETIRSWDPETYQDIYEERVVRMDNGDDRRVTAYCTPTNTFISWDGWRYFPSRYRGSTTS